MVVDGGGDIIPTSLPTSLNASSAGYSSLA